MTIELQTILYRDTDGELKLWACRGVGKGCKRNKTRTNAKPCDDCFGPLDESMTLEQVHDRITKGDA
jgi:hypothetical protein